MCEYPGLKLISLLGGAAGPEEEAVVAWVRNLSALCRCFSGLAQLRDCHFPQPLLAGPPLFPAPPALTFVNLPLNLLQGWDMGNLSNFLMILQEE